MNSVFQENLNGLTWGPWSSSPEAEVAPNSFQRLYGGGFRACESGTEEDGNGVRSRFQQHPFCLVALQDSKQSALRW